MYYKQKQCTFIASLSLFDANSHRGDSGTMKAIIRNGQLSIVNAN